ncbi:MAG: fibronectin type III domain-containing protein, partial [Candidatus Planktophila sp.]
MQFRLNSPTSHALAAKWKTINWQAHDRRLRRFLSIALIAPVFTFISAVPGAPIAQAATSTTTAPQEVTATANGTSLIVAWGAPNYGASAVTSYQVDYSTDGSTWTSASSTISPGTYSYSISGLTLGTSYYVRVAAKMGASTSPWAYPWVKLYGTVTPKRDSGGNITYEPGYGRASANNQAANFYASASFTRVRYKMQYLSNDGATFNYVITDFTKWAATTGNKNSSGTLYNSPAASITTLEFPDQVNGQAAIQATANDLTVESSNRELNVNGVTGRLQIWANDISGAKGWSGAADGTTDFDFNDSPGNANGFGAFQVHDVTNGRTVFAWNRQLYNSGLADIGIGNSPTCGYAGNIAWVYCGSTSGATYYNTTNRDAWKLETFINAPTKMVANGLLMRFDAKNSSSYSGTGTTWNDISGNGITATLTSESQFTKSTSGSTSPANNTFSHGSMMFSGSSQFATINSGFNYDFSGGFTAAWYGNWGNGAGAYERIFDIGSGAGGANSNNLLVGRNGTSSEMFLELYTAAGASGRCVTPNETARGIDTNWNHWAIVLNGTTCLIYKNGNVVTNTSYTFLPTSNVSRSNVWLGRSNWVADAYLEGGIADIAFYNRPLQFAEVQQLKEDQAGSTVKAGDGTCATRVANPNNVTVTTVANDCVIKFAA